MVLRKVRIFRKTLVGDTFGSLGATEKLEFNVSQDEKVSNGWTKHIKIAKGRGIADNPNPNEDLGENQDTGELDLIYRIDGVVSRADDITNQFKANLNAFEQGEQETTTLPFGKFSIEIDRDPHENISSSATIGLKVKSLTWDEDEETTNMADFVLVLIKSKTV